MEEYCDVPSHADALLGALAHDLDVLSFSEHEHHFALGPLVAPRGNDALSPALASDLDYYDDEEEDDLDEDEDEEESWDAYDPLEEDDISASETDDDDEDVDVRGFLETRFGRFGYAVYQGMLARGLRCFSLSGNFVRNMLHYVLYEEPSLGLSPSMQGLPRTSKTGCEEESLEHVVACFPSLAAIDAMVREDELIHQTQEALVTKVVLDLYTLHLRARGPHAPELRTALLPTCIRFYQQLTTEETVAMVAKLQSVIHSLAADGHEADALAKRNADLFPVFDTPQQYVKFYTNMLREERNRMEGLDNKLLL